MSPCNGHIHYGFCTHSRVIFKTRWLMRALFLANVSVETIRSSKPGSRTASKIRGEKIEETSHSTSHDISKRGITLSHTHSSEEGEKRLQLSMPATLQHLGIFSQRHSHPPHSQTNVDPLAERITGWPRIGSLAEIPIGHTSIQHSFCYEIMHLFKLGWLRAGETGPKNKVHVVFPIKSRIFYRFRVKHL